MDFSAIVEAVGRSIVRVNGNGGRPASGVVWSTHEVVTVARAVDEGRPVAVGIEGQEFKARLKGRDVGTDIALLEVEGTLTVPQFDDGAGAKVGQPALLLARPGETVRASAGIISVRGRKPWRSARGGEIDGHLESDAAHQPGYSGGALVAADGQVLGITSTGLIRGTSLTVPVPTVRRVVLQLSAHGRVRQSYLGLSLQPLRLPDDVQKLTGEEVGLLVVGVEAGGPGERAGVRYGDTVLHLGDSTVKTLEDLYAFLRADHVGETVAVRLFRGGKLEALSLTLGARP